MAMEIKAEQVFHQIDGSPLSVAAWAPATGYHDAMEQSDTPTSTSSSSTHQPEGRGLWTADEHLNFIEGIRMFPSGPWKDIAAHVGSRTARQTMTHAQKYRQKIARRLRNARMNAQHCLPYNLDASSTRYNALLSNDEQFNDSILSTSLAILAEKELDMMEELLGGGDAPADVYQPLSPSEMGFDRTALLQDRRQCEANELPFEECIDFLIAKFHDNQLP